MKKLLSIMLCLCMLLTIAPFAALAANDFANNGSSDGYYKVVSKNDWDTAPGITESEIVLNNDSGTRRQVLHFMKADISNEYVKVIATYQGMDTTNYQVADMEKQTKWLIDNWGVNVVGAMNTCLSWYNGDTYVQHPERINEPLGVMVVDGETLFDHQVGFDACVVINYDSKDGVARPADMPKVQMKEIQTSADLTGWEEQVIPCSSGFIVDNGVNKYTKAHSGDDAPRSVVGITAAGEVVIMENDGRQTNFSEGMTMYELAEAMIAMGCSYAVNCDGGGSSQFLAKRPGSTLKVVNSPSDGALRNTTNGIAFISTAPADGEFKRAHITVPADYYTPESTVQFSAIGADLAGNEVAIPESATWQLDDAEMGSIDANGLFTSSGKEGKVTAELLYNGEVVGSAVTNIVIPDISFKSQMLVLPYGEASEVSMNVTTNNGLNKVVTKPGDIVLTLSDPALATINGTELTTCSADSGLTGGTLTAVPCGDESKKVSVELKFGRASNVAIDFENDYQLVVDSNLNPTEKGWAAFGIQGGQYLGYRWYAQNLGRNTPLGCGAKTNIYLVDENTGKVRNGEHALAVDIDWTYVTSMGAKQVDVWLDEPIDLADSVEFGFWVYFPESYARLGTAPVIRICGASTLNDDGTIATSTSADIALNSFYDKSGIDKEGWYYFSYDNTGTNKFRTLDLVQFRANDNSADLINAMPDVTFYFDDFTVDYSDAAIDRANPYFTSMGVSVGAEDPVEVKGQTINSNTVFITAQANENTTKSNYTGLDPESVVMTVDGKPVPGVTANASGKISVSNLELSDGVHTIRVEIADMQGNVGSISRKLVVNTKDSAVNLNLVLPEDGSNPPAGSIVPLQLTVDDLSKVSSVTAKLSLDGENDWELQGITTPYGFEATYTANANNDVFITITKTSDDADCSGNVLATLPIRVWTAKGYLDPSLQPYVKDDPGLQDKYWVLTPYAMWLSDGVCKINIQAEIEEGSITYTDGDSDTFSSEKIDAVTELNRYRNSKNDGDANFYQDKKSFHIHEAGEPQSKAPTCTEPGYENRVFCVGCTCGTVEKYGHKCDTADGCGSVIEWGTAIPATGHTYELDNGVLKCKDCKELFNGVRDGKTYKDGVAFNGWAENDTMYFVDGVMLTGSHVIDKTVYTFDDNGIYQSDKLFNDFIETKDGVMYFYSNTNYEKNYVYLNDTAYYFEDGIAVDGEYVINGETCLFEDGVYKSCSTADVMDAGWMGDDVTYIVYADGSMFLGGEGDTYVYKSRAQLPWVKYKTKISSIVIGKDITSLGQFALADIYYANSITFEEGSKLKSIGAAAVLSNYYATEIVIPESVEKISQNAFKMCKGITSIYLPQDITFIHPYAFVNNQNKPMPNIVLNVAAGSYAETYAQTNNIPYVTREYVAKPVASGACGDNATWALYSDGKFVVSGSGAMTNYAERDTQPWAEYLLQIKDIVIGKDITAVGNYAFAYAHNVKSITFEEGSKLDRIGMLGFFYLLNVTEVNLPDTVTYLGSNAFGYCKKLANVYVPQDVSYIHPATFRSCPAVELNVAEGSYAETFAQTNSVAYTTRAYIPDAIASGACGDNATWALYSDGKFVVSGSGAMTNYTERDTQPWAEYLLQIKDIVIGKDITAIGNYAFAYAHNVKSITFEEGSKLERIGTLGFFYLLNVTEVNLPDTVTYLGSNAFGYCKKLANIYIPDGVSYIHTAAFRSCPVVELNVASGSYAETFAQTNSIAYTTR